MRGCRCRSPPPDTLPVFVVVRAIQRVRHGPHELPCRVAPGDGRVRVQGNDILHVRQNVGVPTTREKRSVAPPRKQRFKSASFPRLRS